MLANSEDDLIFGQFQLSCLPQLNLKLIKTVSQMDKTNALISGCIKRYQASLYKGKKYYFQDLQAILENDAINAPSLMKNKLIHLNKQETQVLVQCRDCSKYTVINKFCGQCEDVHYCTQACQMKVKFTHQRGECHPKSLPKIDKALQVEVHFGSDLGQNVAIYFQHQSRMSLNLRGKSFLEQMHKAFSEGDMQTKISENWKVEMMPGPKKHVLFRQVNETAYVTGIEQISIGSLEELACIYEQNNLLSGIQVWLLKEGALLGEYIQQVHNNHLHLAYIFKVC